MGKNTLKQTVATGTCRALNHFAMLDDTTFVSTQSYYINDASTEVDAFYGFIANSIARYLATGDVDPVNKAVQGALAAGRYRTFMRIAKNLVAHKWDKAGKKLIGKIDPVKRCKLVAVDTNSGLEQFEMQLRANTASEQAHAKAKPAKAWDEDAAIAQLIKKAQENKADLAELVQKVSDAAKAV